MIFGSRSPRIPFRHGSMTNGSSSWDGPAERLNIMNYYESESAPSLLKGIWRRFSRFQCSADRSAGEESSDPYAREREVFKWVLSVGGKVFAEGNKRLEVSVASQQNFSPGTVRRIGLHGVESLRNEGPERIAGLPGLTILSITQSPLDSNGLHYVLRNRNLTSLDLSRTNILSSDLDRLSVLPYLSELSVSSDQLPNHWDFLDKLPALRSLFVFDPSSSSSSFDELDVSGLGRHRNLREFRYGNGIKIPQLALESLQAENPDLELWQLKADATWIGRGAAPIGRMRAAKQLADKGWTFKGTRSDGSEWKQDAPDAWDPAQRTVLARALVRPITSGVRPIRSYYRRSR